MHRAVVAAVLATLIASGCRKPAKPSPEYTAAQARFVALYGEKLDDAYGLPEMDELLAQLGRVPPDSLDARAAADLSRRIREGRTKLQAEEAALKKAAEAALSPQPAAQGPGRKVLAGAGGGAAEPEGEIPDAGTEGPPQPGMTSQEFDQKFGTCFSYGNQVKVAGKGLVESRLLNDRLQCQKRLPGFDKQAVLFENGKVLAVVDRAQYEAASPKATVVKVDAGTPAPPAK
ncbi:MAG: hypothetical protein RL653_1719 [Pseudomonadota bacterium]|jgi:hypothetical protein